MATNDDDVIVGLAKVIACQRDLFRDDAETVAAQRGWTVDQLIEAITWFRKVSPHYRGPILDSAERAATAMRKPRIQACGEIHAPVLSKETVAAHIDPVDPTRPERPCARCRNIFQPTLKRRLLCRGCYADDDRAGPENMTELLRATAP